jgi:hypothetical protein
MAAEPSEPGSYRAPLRAARRLVQRVPTAWPPPLRRTAQLLLIPVAVIFLLLAWVVATLIQLTRGIGQGPRTGGW